MWKDELKEIKMLFEVLTTMSKEKHIEIYGENYKYTPKKTMYAN